MLSNEQFQGWKGHPVTKEAREHLQGLRDGLLESIASGATLYDKERTALVIGQIQGIDEFLNIRFEGET